MGALAKAAYRRFLQSEEWSSVRLQCLARDNAVCRLCKIRDLHNDAHHIRYPKRWADTKVSDLVTLCRRCHNHVHDIMERQGIPCHWDKIRQEVDLPGVNRRPSGVEMARLHAKRCGKIKGPATFHELTIVIARVIHFNSCRTQTDRVGRR